MFEFMFNFWSFIGGMLAGAIGLFIVCFVIAMLEERKYWYDDYPSFED